MIFTIFEVSQLHSAIYAVVQGAVVSCLQHQELGCLPESLCWLQAPSLSMFPVITSVNEDRCTMLSLQGAYKGDIGSPLLGREHCGMAQGHLACHGTTVPLLPALLGPALGLLRHLSEHGPGGLLRNSLLPGAWVLSGIVPNCTSSPGQSSLLGLPCSELCV